MAAKKAKPSNERRNRRASVDPLHAPELYLNRHLSWLEFNRRVLDEAFDERNPVLERVRFISIFSSNLDEFFMVHVAGLKDQRIGADSGVGRDGMTYSEQLSAIKLLVSDLSTRQRRCWHEELIPQLRARGIAIEEYSDLSGRDRRLLSDVFQRQVYPVLTPLAVDAGHPFPHISNLSINLLIVIEDERGRRLARLKIPGVIPRFVRVPEPERDGAATGRRMMRFVLLEDVITANLDRLFPGKRVKDTYVFRITRDADLEFRDDDGDSLIETVEQELEQRHFGFVVRLTVEPRMPADLRAWLANKLNVPADDVYVLDTPHALSDAMQLYAIDRPDLKDPPFVPRVPPAIREATTVIEAVDQQDLLLYHPYDSFTPVMDFIRQSAVDRDVVAIKQTLYRVGSQSPIVDALLEARDDDTQVAVLVELKARFDEESNIQWARALEKTGVHVAHGLAGLKTHCKIAMVVRREGDGLRRYVHLGTGNYNVSTARGYTDLGLLTCDEEIASDASDVFNFLTGYSAQTEYRKLLVAPVNMRARLVQLIEREAEFGRDGHIIMKVNSISDNGIITSLFRAAQAGVRIDLIVRGICCLRPGVPGVSETINVRSIVGRFLEHPRIFYFAHGGEDGDNCVYAGSADMMRRNLDFRVEVLFPIEDPRLRRYVREGILDLQLRDTRRARILQRDGSYVRPVIADGDAEVDSQAVDNLLDAVPTLRAVPPLLRAVR